MARGVVEGGLSKAAVARQFNTTPKTVGKWVARFQAEGPAGLMDRSSRPRSSPSQTGPAACERVEALRRQRYTGEQIAAEVGVSHSSPKLVGYSGRLLAAATSAALPPPSVASSNAWASIGCRRSSRSAAMNAPRPARSSTSTSRSSASSIGSVTGSPAAGSARASPAGSAGNMCTWRSTTTRGSLIRRSCRTRSEPPACAFSSTPCASFEASASRSSAS